MGWRKDFLWLQRGRVQIISYQRAVTLRYLANGDIIVCNRAVIAKPDCHLGKVSGNCMTTLTCDTSKRKDLFWVTDARSIALEKR
jgi:hypothetical protein